jgi:hypothetical protein
VSERGLDFERLYALSLEQGDECFRAYLASRGAYTSFEKNPEALFDVDAELFVPAARTTVFASVEELGQCRQENADVLAASLLR